MRFWGAMWKNSESKKSMKQFSLRLKKLLFLGTLSSLSTSQETHSTSSIQALLIDTTGTSDYDFASVRKYATNAGFIWSYSSLLDSIPESIEHYQAIFVALDPLLLHTTLHALANKAPLHPLSTRLVTLLEKLRLLDNNLICLLLPGTNSFNAAWVQLCSAFITQIGGHFPASQEQQLQEFLNFTMQPDHLLRQGHATSLLNEQSTPSEGRQLINRSATPYLLPFQSTKESSDRKKPNKFSTLPLGLYLPIGNKKKKLVITKRSLITADALQENFMLLPNTQDERNSFCNHLQHFFIDIYTLCYPTASTLPYNNYADMRNKLDILEQSLSPNWRKITKNNKVIGGWADPESYHGCEATAAQNLVALDLDFLWMEWNPEWFLSNKARKKDECQAFLEKINLFTQAIAAQKKPFPALFLGTDITSNFASHLAPQPVEDMFGTRYPNIPSPFDVEGFWKPEVLDVFDGFLRKWPEINNGIPLAGIFFDLEMYHCPTQAAQYTNHMDFSPCAWRAYGAQRPEALFITPDAPVLDKINYLIAHKKLSDYFKVLQEAARTIGLLLKDHFKSKNPDLLIGAYNINLPHSWFYLGFLAGLSSKEEPIVMATFNNEFAIHQEWLEHQGVYLVHLPVIMLGKLTKREDFELITTQARGHHGIWLNRISRLEEPRDPQKCRWNYGPEITPLPTDQFIECLQDANKQKIESH